MKVREIMRKPFATLLLGTPISEALARMGEWGVTSLAVIDEQGVLAGVVTGPELSRRIEEGKVERSSPIRDWLSTHLVTATPEMDVDRLAEMMHYKGISNIMVTEGRILVGAVTSGEVESAMAGKGKAQA